MCLVVRASRQGSPCVVWGSRLWWPRHHLLLALLCVDVVQNSDRHPNEESEVVVLPRTSHDLVAAPLVRCTYVAVPQVAQTNGVLLCKPCWMWGAEMGVNDCGVAVGNEATWAATPPSRHRGLLGMDLVRLLLERAFTAAGALDVLAELLMTHGQGGDCGYNRSGFYYHNSFLIADASEAWVVDTVGRTFAAKRVAAGVVAISNVRSITTDWDARLLPVGDGHSGGVEWRTRESQVRVRTSPRSGRCSDGASRCDDFMKLHGDNWLYSTCSYGKHRCAALRGFLQARAAGRGAGVAPGGVSLCDCVAALQDHGVDRASPLDGFVAQDVCMHAGTMALPVKRVTGIHVADWGDTVAVWVV